MGGSAQHLHPQPGGCVPVPLLVTCCHSGCHRACPCPSRVFLRSGLAVPPAALRKPLPQKVSAGGHIGGGDTAQVSGGRCVDPDNPPSQPWGQPGDRGGAQSHPHKVIVRGVVAPGGDIEPVPVCSPGWGLGWGRGSWGDPGGDVAGSQHPCDTPLLWRSG